MTLPENFSFNQQNLQDFVDCQRLFSLRHMQKLEWPALESEPVLEHEELMRLGEQFHLLVHQQGVGIPDEVIETSIKDPMLDSWWQEFKKIDIKSINGLYYYETLISVPFLQYRLVAKYDLVIYADGDRAIIYDWKTSQKAPDRRWLQKRLQTRVYPLVMALKQEVPKVDPESIKMSYWYPAFPESTVDFDYSQSQFQTDQEYITSLIENIQKLNDDQFEKTAQTRRCEFCRYRSLCGRGEIAGNWHDQTETDTDTGSAFDIDFDQLSPGD